MSYDKPNIRDFKHGAPYVSIWYSIIIHILLFIAVLNLARIDYRLMVSDFKKEVKGVISGILAKGLSPEKSLINELFRENKIINTDSRNIRSVKADIEKIL